MTPFCEMPPAEKQNKHEVLEPKGHGESVFPEGLQVGEVTR